MSRYLGCGLANSASFYFIFFYSISYIKRPLSSCVFYVNGTSLRRSISDLSAHLPRDISLYLVWRIFSVSENIQWIRCLLRTVWVIQWSCFISFERDLHLKPWKLKNIIFEYNCIPVRGCILIYFYTDWKKRVNVIRFLFLAMICRFYGIRIIFYSIDMT